MLRQVSVTNPSGETLVLPFSDLIEGHGLLVVSVDGLGPPNAVINSTSGANYDGVRISSTRTTNRVIDITIGVQGSGSLEESHRLDLYKYFPIKQLVTFDVVTDTREGSIEGYVEKNDISMFGPVENTTITIVCEDAYFKDENEQSFDFSGTTNLFEFPFMNDSLTESLIIMGEGLSLVETVVPYLGDAPNGAVITLTALGDVEHIQIVNDSWNETMNIDTDIVNSLIGGPLILGDTIVIDTRPGEKSVTHWRAGVPTNVMNSLAIGTDWIRLYPGPNNIIYDAVIGLENLDVLVEYDVLYEGM